MIRFILRTISVICLALSVMYMIIDATRSVGVSELVWTPLVESWSQLFPDSLTNFSNWLSTSVHPLLNDPILATLLNLPTFAIFAGLAALFYIIGYKRPRRSDQFLDH